MPRNSSGVYSQPAGTAAVSLQPISSSAYNTLISDIGDEITGSLPRDGSAPMLAPLTLVSVDPVLDDHAARKFYVDTKATAAKNAATAVSLNINTPQTLTATQKKAVVSAIGAIPQYATGAALPGANIGPIWHDDYMAVMTWRTIGTYTGYASVDMGVLAYFAKSSPPAGWLECNGAAISRTAYAALFATIGTIYGAGDGGTTFNLPDRRATFDRGWDHGRWIDSGRAFGTYQDDAFQNHEHGLAQPLPSYVANRSLPNGSLTLSDASSAVNYTEGVRTGWKSNPEETRPKNVAFLPIIKI